MKFFIYTNTIKDFFEQEKIVRKNQINKIFWLLKINFMLNILIHKSDLCIYLFIFPVSSYYNDGNRFIAYEFNNESKHLIIFNIFLLLKAYNYLSNIKTVNFSYSFLF